MGGKGAPKSLLALKLQGPAGTRGAQGGQQGHLTWPRAALRGPLVAAQHHSRATCKVPTANRTLMQVLIGPRA